jgi:hypothetical protein
VTITADGAATEAHRARAEHQPCDAIGVSPRNQLRDQRTHRVPRDDEPVDAANICDRDDIVGEVIEIEVR